MRGNLLKTANILLMASRLCLAAAPHVVYVADAVAQISAPFEQDIDLNVRAEYYPVQGTTPQEVIQDIYLKSPGNGLSHELARTDSAMDVSVTWKSDGYVCTVHSVDIKLDITYRYPQPPTVILMTSEWERFLAKLVEHEEHHGAIYKNMAGHFAAEVRKLTGPHSPNCEGMRDVQNRLQAAVVEWFGQKHVAFDKNSSGSVFVSEYLAAAAASESP